ncbi:YegP family protein, partial [Rhodococcus sp. T7]|uniref:YegP family protein n=1 Tax=Rhodococcus sp. T7 TaxID=627444 RepID=UPI001F3775C0
MIRPGLRCRRKERVRLPVGVLSDYRDRRGFATRRGTWRRRDDDCELRAFKDAAGKFRFRLKAANGESIAVSQAAPRRQRLRPGWRRSRTMPHPPHCGSDL